MEDILAMVEGPRTSEIATFDQIDYNIVKELLAKSSVWDFYEMSKEEYLNKDDNQRQSLIIKFYNEMVKGKSQFFVSFLLSGFCALVLIGLIFESILSSITGFSPVFDCLLLIEKLLPAFDLLYDLSSIKSLFADSSSVDSSSEVRYGFLSNAPIKFMYLLM